MPYCRNCGKEVSPDANFCNSCGHEIEGAKPIVQNSAQPDVQQIISQPEAPRVQPAVQHAATQQPLNLQPLQQKPAYESVKVYSASTSDKRKTWKTLFIISLVILISVCVLFVFFFTDTSNKLISTKATLVDTQNQLTSIKSDLSTTQQSLSDTQKNLTSMTSERDSLKNQLTTAQTNLANTQSQLDSTEVQLVSSNNRLKSVQTALDTAQTQLTAAITSLSNTQNELNNLKAQYVNATTGYAYVLNDPTYAEAMSFIAADQTDNHVYNDISYNCFNFSADTITNANNAHIRCANVYIVFPDSAHGIIAFNTTDKGMLYIEPQNDDIVQLKIGGHYYQEEIPPPGYYVPQPSFDDTVENFTVIW